jgi:hypothetical protein
MMDVDDNEASEEEIPDETQNHVPRNIQVA